MVWAVRKVAGTTFASSARVGLPHVLAGRIPRVDSADIGQELSFH